MQSLSSQPREAENYKIVSKGLQRKEACMFEDSRAWTRLIFLDLKLQGFASARPACAQRRATLPAPLTCAAPGTAAGSTPRGETPVKVTWQPHKQQCLYLGELSTLLEHCDFVETMSSDHLWTN